jgi:hypothetical protein
MKKQCRICLDDDDPRMIAPCPCNGTNKWVHRRCLDNWRSESDVAFNRCQTCKTNYVIDVNRNLEREQRQLKKMLAIDIGVMLLLFTIFSLLIGWLMSRCTSDTYAACGSTNPMTWFIVGATSIFFLVGLIVVLGMIASSGTYHTTSTTSECANWWVVAILVMIGMVVVFINFKDWVDKEWKRHTSKRKRSINVLDYVVRDLSESVV